MGDKLNENLSLIASKFDELTSTVDYISTSDISDVADNIKKLYNLHKDISEKDELKYELSSICDAIKDEGTKIYESIGNLVRHSRNESKYKNNKRQRQYDVEIISFEQNVNSKKKCQEHIAGVINGGGKILGINTIGNELVYTLAKNK